MHVFFIKFGIGQDFARDRMLHQKSFQPVANFSSILWPIDQPLIENNADTHVAAFEWDPPTPPSVADNVIRRSITRCVDGRGPLRIFLSKLAAVPVFHAFPS